MKLVKVIHSRGVWGQTILVWVGNGKHAKKEGKEDAEETVNNITNSKHCTVANGRL